MQQATQGTVPLPVSACAAVTACGIGTEVLYAALLRAEHRLRAPQLFDIDFPAYVGEIPDPLPPLPLSLEKYATRNARIALAAIDSDDGLRAAVRTAVTRYGADRVGVVLGTSTSGIYETELAYRYRLHHGELPPEFRFESQHAWIATADFVHRELGLRGPCYTISTACSSSSKSIAAAQRLISSGICDAVVAGGVDSLCRLTLYGFKSLDLMAEDPCTPLDRDRSGVSLGEGAGLMLIERPHADWRTCVHLLGTGESSDAHHMTAPHPEGKGAIIAMQRAFAQARLNPRQIDYVNMHATGTPQNDSVEMLAMAQVFDDDVQCSGTKGLTGHTLGAAGAVEAAISWLALTKSMRPGTCGLKHVDPAFDRSVIAQPQPEANLSVVMTNNFGFGGNNSSLIFGIPHA